MISQVSIQSHIIHHTNAEDYVLTEPKRQSRIPLHMFCGKLNEKLAISASFPSLVPKHSEEEVYK
jgi:hypothetical protein